MNALWNAPGRLGLSAWLTITSPIIRTEAHLQFVEQLKCQFQEGMCRREVVALFWSLNFWSLGTAPFCQVTPSVRVHASSTTFCRTEKMNSAGWCHILSHPVWLHSWEVMGHSLLSCLHFRSWTMHWKNKVSLYLEKWPHWSWRKIRTLSRYIRSHYSFWKLLLHARLCARSWESNE